MIAQRKIHKVSDNSSKVEIVVPSHKTGNSLRIYGTHYIRSRYRFLAECKRFGIAVEATAIRRFRYTGYIDSAAMIDSRHVEVILS